MKIAVITPCYQPHKSWLQQCLDSVVQQTLSCTHFLIYDGSPSADMVLPDGVQEFHLPGPHQDTGNAARAIGSVSAICQGFEAIAYLDADNWYEPNHLELLQETQRRTGAAVCTSARTLHSVDGSLLGRCPEVDGEQFVDTNCLFLTQQAFGLVAAWYLMPREQVRIGDRVVWNAIRDAKLSCAHTEQPTVHYRTMYAVHYHHFGKTPPPGAKDVRIPLPKPAKTQSNPTPSTTEVRFPRDVRHPKVSLCMIVKNEEANLVDCLTPMVGLVDELIVVDTGSTDRTLEVALALGARVIDFPWVEDFSAARNAGLRHARGEWIFWLDADDRIDAENRQRLRRLMHQLSPDNTAYLMKQWSPPNPQADSALVVDHVRLFRRHPGVKWRYRIHEQILPSLQETGVQKVVTDIVIHHLGYQEPKLRTEKLQRNIRLLKLEHAEQPEEPFTLFNLAGTYLDLGDIAAAVPYLQQCVQTAPKGSSFLPKAFVLLVQAHRQLGQTDLAWQVCLQGKERFPQEAELLFEEGVLCQGRNEEDRARQCFEQILELPSRPVMVGQDTGIRGHLTRHHLAMLYRKQGRWIDAERQWQEAMRLTPQFGPAWLGLAELHLQLGCAEEVDGLVRRLQSLPQGECIAAVLQARVSVARQDLSRAQELVEQVLTTHRDAIWPRLILIEMLLRHGREEAAERHLRDVLAIDPQQRQAQQKLSALLQQRRTKQPIN